ncbi:MAG: hypothetical protein ACI4OP_01160 [Candidatus Coprovivens sp.]
MELTTEQLFKGKATRIKDKEYFTTEAYVTPFMERVSKLTNNFIINAKPADQISLTKEGEVNFDDVIYNRVWIQGVLPEEYAWDNHKRVISMIYALDTRKPLVKFYVGALNMACLNLCVFNPEMLNVAELEPESAINYSFLRNALSLTDETASMLKQLSNMEFKRDAIFDDLGHWVDNCINSKINTGFGTVKLAESAPIDVYKDLFYDEKSKYYTTDDRVDGFTVYNAFTDLITQDKKDLVNKFEKTLLIKDIMNL